MNKTFREFLEDQELNDINEMSKTIRPKDTGLSSIIWVGDSDNHQPRVKLMTAKSKSTRGGTISILLNRTADVPKGQKNMPNRSQEINDARRWVMYNLDTLIKLDKQFSESKEEVSRLLNELIHFDDTPKDFK